MPPRGSKKNSDPRRPRISQARLEEMIEEATVDAHNESEQITGWFTMIEDNLAVPFETTVLGAPVTVERVDLSRDEQLVAICRRGHERQSLPILDLPLPTPAPDGAEWIEAYSPLARRRMTAGKRKPSQNLQDWIEARKRHHLSHAHVQMARELGMNPKKLGKLDNHDQEPWKAPLPQFIEHLYLKRFGRERPEVVMSVEERARSQEAKRAARKEAKRRARAEGHGAPPGG